MIEGMIVKQFGKRHWPNDDFRGGSWDVFEVKLDPDFAPNSIPKMVQAGANAWHEVYEWAEANVGKWKVEWWANAPDKSTMWIEFHFKPRGAMLFKLRFM